MSRDSLDGVKTCWKRNALERQRGHREVKGVPKGVGAIWERMAGRGRMMGHQWTPVSCAQSTGVTTEG